MEAVEIPGESTQLGVLDVQGNRLRGHLPVSLVTYGNLTEVNHWEQPIRWKNSGGVWVEVGRSLAELVLGSQLSSGEPTSSVHRPCSECCQGKCSTKLPRLPTKCRLVPWRAKAGCAMHGAGWDSSWVRKFRGYICLLVIIRDVVAASYYWEVVYLVTGVCF
ncbi:hypothetical protein Acr_00g0007050 [Actinidia rufa]|uniref:Leucine-rich repeat (LRR) family protein n=1 Tax=Actinidia rufa TaxID=165716 RepID=A0A7J0D9X8_9ERIC|nr:hypothetical protein Acr_00g0007050 [Actinidia rufa]